ncbi:MAG TPA: hypothetical protein VGM02_04850 [Acidobacteriaceae bacterium]|jgi:hypothetical protein
MAYSKWPCWLLFVLLAALQFIAHAQSRTNLSTVATLAAPFDCGTFSPTIDVTVGAKTEFHLETSWIPGKNHKGMFRYKMYVVASDSAVEHLKNPSFYTPEAIAAQMKRIQGCWESLELYDADGFVLRHIPIAFSLGINDKGLAGSLSSNAAEQMDASEYRQFTGNGSWSIKWSCPDDN